MLNPDRTAMLVISLEGSHQGSSTVLALYPENGLKQTSGVLKNVLTLMRHGVMWIRTLGFDGPKFEVKYNPMRVV